MSAEQLTALLNFFRVSSKSWGVTCRTIVLITGTIWLPLIGLTAILGRSGQFGLPAAAITGTGVGLGAVVHVTRRARHSQSGKAGSQQPTRPDEGEPYTSGSGRPSR